MSAVCKDPDAFPAGLGHAANQICMAARCDLQSLLELCTQTWHLSMVAY